MVPVAGVAQWQCEEARRLAVACRARVQLPARPVVRAASERPLGALRLERIQTSGFFVIIISL